MSDYEPSESAELWYETWKEDPTITQEERMNPTEQFREAVESARVSNE